MDDDSEDNDRENLNYSAPTSMNADKADITCEDLYIGLGTITKAISRLRPDKAMGPDELSAKLLII